MKTLKALSLAALVAASVVTGQDNIKNNDYVTIRDYEDCKYRMSDIGWKIGEILSDLPTMSDDINSEDYVGLKFRIYEIYQDVTSFYMDSTFSGTRFSDSKDTLNDDVVHYVGILDTAVAQKYGSAVNRNVACSDGTCNEGLNLFERIVSRFN